MDEAELREFCREVILDHSRHPRNFRKLPEANRSAEGSNPLLGNGLGESVVTDFSPEGFLRISVTRNPAATDVTQAIEVSGTLTGWGTDGTTVDEDTSSFLQAHGNTPVSAGETRFIRLNVTR